MVKTQFPKCPVISYLNVNSIRNKFNSLKTIVTPFVDVLCEAETKLDSSFSTAQFKLQGFSQPFRLDKSRTSGGLLTYVRSTIPSRALTNCPISDNIQCIPIELNMKIGNWLLLSCYRPPSQKLSFFLDKISFLLDFYACIYSNILILGDLNDTIYGSEIAEFTNVHSLTSLILTPTCFKSKEGRCIDLILTNKQNCVHTSGTFDTDISDFHHLVFTVLKSQANRLPPKKITYRCYKKFSVDSFRTELNHFISISQSGDFAALSSAFEKALDKHAPRKTRFVRGNEQPHMTGNLHKAIMKRTRLKQRATKSGCTTDLQAYKKQRNLVVSLNRKEKKLFFQKAGNPKVKNGKSFWKVFKPFFSKKNLELDGRIFLREDDSIVTEEKSICNIFNRYFVNIAKTLPIQPNEDFSSLDEVFEHYRQHRSVQKIRNQQHSEDLFELKHVNPSEVKDVVLKLDPQKATSGAIPTDIFQQSVDDYLNPLTDCINCCFLDGVFPSELSLAEITPVFKNKDRLNKVNYRPISLLPVVPKVYENIISSQIKKYIEPRLSKLLCGFRAKHNTQHALFRLLCKWQENLDRGEVVGTVAMDLSKAFDTLPHGLLLAKLKAYGFSRNSLKLIFSYLTNRQQRTKVGSSLSEWLRISLGVPQGSILGPLLFNIFLNDIFLFIEQTDLCNFADDNSMYSSAKSIEQVIERLKHDLQITLKWFESNGLVANPDKFQLMFLGASSTSSNEGILTVGTSTLIPSEQIKLLGVTIDNQLNFDLHITNLCTSANKKINCLHRIKKYLDTEQLKAISSAYILSTFSYAPLIWMFCKKGTYEKVEKTHKRCLKAIHCQHSANNSGLSYPELLAKTGSVSIHTHHLRSLLSEIYKCVNGLSPDIMSEFFVSKQINYSFRSSSKLKLPKSKTLSYGINTPRFKGCYLWNCLQPSIKQASSLATFKSSLQSLDIKCTCRICK